jgi:hypothetical protein
LQNGQLSACLEWAAATLFATRAQPISPGSDSSSYGLSPGKYPRILCYTAFAHWHPACRLKTGRVAIIEERPYENRRRIG